MPPQNNNSNDYSQGYGQQGPAQTGPRQTDNPLQSFVDSLPKGKADLKDIANLLMVIGELLTKQQTSASATRKSYKDHSSELRAQVAFQDEILDSTKKIAEYQKRIQKDGKPPSMAATLRAYREMEKLSKAHLEKGMFSKAQTAAMKKNVAEMQAAIKALKANKGDAFDSTELDKYIAKLGRLNRDTIGLARNMKGVRLSTLTQDHNSAVRSINLTFGKDLAWQERKSASFAFTPLYSGYHVGWTSGKKDDRLSCNGFVPTRTFAYPVGGINMATAVAISGAAVSPNSGYHTNPATAFLLTMFNVQLGWWLRNPRRSSFAGEEISSDHTYQSNEPAAPRFPALKLASEMRGSVGDTTDFVYLSDGGHFENMGLYELVRRHCRFNVICDAEEDHGFTFSGIGNAIKRCASTSASRSTSIFSLCAPNLTQPSALP